MNCSPDQILDQKPGFRVCKQTPVWLWLPWLHFAQSQQVRSVHWGHCYRVYLKTRKEHWDQLKANISFNQFILSVTWQYRIQVWNLNMNSFCWKHRWTSLHVSTTLHYWNLKPHVGYLPVMRWFAIVKALYFTGTKSKPEFENKKRRYRSCF